MIPGGGGGGSTIPAQPAIPSGIQVGDLLAGISGGAIERLAKGAPAGVLTVGGADPSGLEWAPAAGGVDSFCAFQAGNVGANLVTVLSPAVTVGTWVLIGWGTCAVGGARTVDLELGSGGGAFGTAVYTFPGGVDTVATSAVFAAAGTEVLVVAGIATVTVGGTIALWNAADGALTFQSASTRQGRSGAGGLVGIKVA